MVNPIYLFVIALAAGFLLSLIDKAGRSAALTVFYAALAAMAGISAQAFIAILGGAESAMIFTAGFKPPFSINLQMGLEESFFTMIVNVLGLLSGIYLVKKLKTEKVYALVLYLMMIMGLNGLIMTRDLFNLFVFLEITSIATYSLIGIERNIRSLSAGFKYMIAGGLASMFFLIGTIYLYRFTGVLHLDSMAEALDLASGPAVVLAVFTLLISVLIELKPFPANGWALDVYEAADDGLVAVIASASSAAMLFVLYKITPLLNGTLLLAVAGIGLTTFVLSNLMGLMQHSPKRLLGYSSIGQIGLIMGVYALLVHSGAASEPMTLLLVAGGLFINHFIAKAGLFWLAGLVGKDSLEGWHVLRKKPVLVFMFGVFILALVGLPPFPGFFAKWQLVMVFSEKGLTLATVLVLLGSFLEAAYLFRWLGKVLKTEGEGEVKTSFAQGLPLTLSALALIGLGAGFSLWIPGGSGLKILYLPMLLAAALFLLDFLPAWVKNTLVILLMSLYAWQLLPGLEGYRFLFGIIFLAGGVLLLIPGYAFKGKRRGFYPFAVMMYAGLAALLISESTLQLFAAWEIMTLGSYFLIIRGKRSEPHALSYMLFSIGGAFVMLMGLGLLYGVNGQSLALTSLETLTQSAGVIFLLIMLGFLTKIASMGLHIWLPGAHGEAETDVSPMVSAILLKAGMFGLIVLMSAIRRPMIGNVDITYWMSWLGAITVFLGNLLAIYQEDAKRLLAYSSVGNLGYVLFGLSMMTHMGWLTSIAFALNHFLFKALLFLAIGGVVMRVKTKNMYEMGGLIKRMPVSFISVLIGIIALSGVPPLSGYAGKWLTFNILLEKGWYLQGLVLIIGGLIAFLYCFRLIYAVFLGQLKDNHRRVKEAPLPVLIPQIILMIAIMFFSAYPGLVLHPVGDFLLKYFPQGAISWQNNTALTAYGHWDGLAVLIITGVMFASVFALLLITNRKAQKVGQFNIVYAAERPSRPELTHVGYNFFAHYRKALGIFSRPFAVKFWDGVSEFAHSAADLFRKIYSGNGQTYLVHIILFVVVVYAFVTGG
ncbi:MAG: NADH-quinone oxidoreductase subunit F [Candidatus Marinimicrobia bacterium]|nr:NADH-quinone oxidoreductase subunit F [Candidatus Neomarinimicrobiota bacterium]